VTGPTLFNSLSHYIISDPALSIMSRPRTVVAFRFYIQTTLQSIILLPVGDQLQLAIISINFMFTQIINLMMSCDQIKRLQYNAEGAEILRPIGPTDKQQLLITSTKTVQRNIRSSIRTKTLFYRIDFYPFVHSVQC